MIRKTMCKHTLYVLMSTTKYLDKSIQNLKSRNINEINSKVNDGKKTPAANTLNVECKNERSSLKPKGPRETSKTGRVSGRIYLAYLKAGMNAFSGILLFLAVFGMNAFYSYSDIWMSEWANSRTVESESNNSREYQATRPIPLYRLNRNSTVSMKAEERHNLDELMVYFYLIIGLGLFKYQSTQSLLSR